MSHYTLEELLARWTREQLTSDQAVGQLMQILRELEQNLRELERRLRELERPRPADERSPARSVAKRI